MKFIKRVLGGTWCFLVHCGIQDRWRKLPNNVRLDFVCEKCGTEWVWAPAGRKA